MANYYDTDDILAEEELVPSVFQHNASGVGLFDSSDDTDKVEAGSRAELPFWLVRELYLRQLLSLKVPPCFDRESKTREEIAADAAHVDLRNRCPYFYELGCKLAPLFNIVFIISRSIVAKGYRVIQLRLQSFTARVHFAAVFLVPTAVQIFPKYICPCGCQTRRHLIQSTSHRPICRRHLSVPMFDINPRSLLPMFNAWRSKPKEGHGVEPAL